MKHTTIILPNAISLDAQQGRGGKFRITYTERFHARRRDMAEIMRRTVHAISDPYMNMGCDIEMHADGLGVTVTGTVTREQLATMICGEMMMWSALGRLRLVDLLGGLIGELGLARRRIREQHEASEATSRTSGAVAPIDPQRDVVTHGHGNGGAP